MRTQPFIVSILFVLVFFSCKKENESATVWYYYSELDCNLTPFTVTNDSLQNFENCKNFLQNNGIAVLSGYPRNHGSGRAILACGGPRHFGFTHYVLIHKKDIDKAVSIKLQPMAESDL
ncbi:MAG: hypothetical protein ACO1PI_16920 [Bacteroidota bacterium]